MASSWGPAPVVGGLEVLQGSARRGTDAGRCSRRSEPWGVAYTLSRSSGPRVVAQSAPAAAPAVEVLAVGIEQQDPVSALGGEDLAR